VNCAYYFKITNLTLEKSRVPTIIFSSFCNTLFIIAQLIGNCTSPRAGPRA
jgi:hypothetical protein